MQVMPCSWLHRGRGARAKYNKFMQTNYYPSWRPVNNDYQDEQHNSYKYWGEIKRYDASSFSVLSSDLPHTLRPSYSCPSR